MTAERPFVDRRVDDLDRAAVAAATAAHSWHLPTPTLLRHGMNAIYACGDVVVRVGRATATASASPELADVMAERGIRVATPVPGAAADVDGFAVTAWERIDPVNTPVDWSSVGELVSRLHRIEPDEIPSDYPTPSPTAFPWWDFDALLGQVAEHIDDVALAGLCATVDAGSWWRDAIGEAPVVCHGDVHPGNVLMTVDGPVLIDFDLLCRASPAWDHAMLTTYADRWGGDPAVYGSFAKGYGRSLSDDELTVTVASLRNVAATLMRVRAGITDPTARAEARRRLRFWRGDPDAPQWRAQ